MNGDIELEIGTAEEPGAYTVKVLHSAAGGRPKGRLRLDTEDLLDRHAQLENSVLASAVPRRRFMPSDEQLLQQVGQQLFEAAFNGAVESAYRASLGAVQQAGKRMRVALHLAAPELVALPWEAMFDRQSGSYLCRTEPLIRHVDAPYTPEPLEVKPPLRILGLVSSPRGLPALDVQAEKQCLEQALAEPIEAGQVELTWARDASWSTIHHLLLSGTWHILHFIGHGDFDPNSDEGVLALVGPDGRIDRVEASRLTTLLSSADPTPQLVVLNSCSSGQEGSNDLFSGTASALVHGGINAVAAMQFSISDLAALRFARGFYDAIACGKPVDEAVRSGRIEIMEAARSLEWVTPVLYVRGGLTQLFKLTGPPARQYDRTAATTQQPGTLPALSISQAALNALYIQARAELRIQNYDRAAESLHELIALDPSHPAAKDLLQRAEHGQQLAQTYARGLSAEESGELATAIREYDAILQTDPAYRDTGQRREQCCKQQQISDWQAELHYHYDAGNWQAVLDVNTELLRLDPMSADPAGLATRAQQEIGKRAVEAREELPKESSLERLWRKAKGVGWGSRPYKSDLKRVASALLLEERVIGVCRIPFDFSNWCSLVVTDRNIYFAERSGSQWANLMQQVPLSFRTDEDLITIPRTEVAECTIQEAEFRLRLSGQREIRFPVYLWSTYAPIVEGFIKHATKAADRR